MHGQPRIRFKCLISCWITFFRTSCLLWDNENILHSRTVHKWQYCACTLHDGYKQTLRIHNNYCFPLQQWFHEHALTLRSYISCLVIYVIVQILCLQHVAPSIGPSFEWYIYIYIYICSYSITLGINTHESPGIQITQSILMLHDVPLCYSSLVTCARM